MGGWTRAGGTFFWAGFAPTAEAGLTLCALHVASINAKPAPSAAAKALRWGALLLAFRGDATPGRYATEAMEHSGGDPGGSGEGLMSRVQEANVRAFRQKHGLLQDSDFGFAFEAFEDAVRAGGHFVAAEWARVRAEQQAHLLPAGAAVVEADPWRVTPVGPSTLRRPAVRLPTSNVGLRLRQNPDNAEAVGRRVNLLTEAFMKLGVLRPRRYDNPDRYADWQQAVRRLPQERVTQSEATTFQELSLFLAARGVQDPEELDFHAFLEQAMSPSRALQSLRWLSNNGRLQWQLDRLKPPKVIGKVRKARSQAVVVEPPMLLTLEGRIIEMQQARDPAWTAALSSWLVASGCLRYKHLCLSTPVKISREFFHGHCRKGKQSQNRQGFDWCAPARFSNGWHWADKWLEDYQGLAPEQHDKCGICFHPASGQAWPIREVQRVTQHLFHGVVEPLEQLTSYSWRRLLPTVGSLIRLQDAEIVSWETGRTRSRSVSRCRSTTAAASTPCPCVPR